jgi:hypothetical protein
MAKLASRLRARGSASPQARFVSFLLALGAVFALAFAFGSASDPAETDAGAAHGDASHGDAAHVDQPPSAAQVPPGLAVSEDGYSLRLEPTFLETGSAEELRFQIEDADGETVTDFDLRHEREMHLIVVRRDGAHFQHLHPEVDAAGTWTADLTLPTAGAYRAFADFSVGGSPLTLAADLFAPGAFDARPFPADAAVDRVGGYEVRLADPSPAAGRQAALRFLVSRDGNPLQGIETYLGAKGHLVALREGDLAFLHAHPHEGEIPPSVIPYTAAFPTAGHYLLFLQFKHAGQLRTAQFTIKATER